MNTTKNKLLLIVSIMMILILSTAYGQESAINIEYVFAEKNQTVVLNTEVDLETNCLTIIDKEHALVSGWQADDIVDGTVTYQAAFAGWKLLSINGEPVSAEYIYPDNDIMYFDDKPFSTYNGNVNSLKFQALWGKTVYVRDPYNFIDITNVYGYNVAGTTGDILTAKIAWDTSTTYSSDTNDGATQTTPVSTLTKAYDLLKNSNGGKICIVNHLTIEGKESAQSYYPSFTNASSTETFELGDNLNINGLITITGKGLGSGTSVENKANAGATFENGYLYIKNTRGAGLYNGKTYTAHSFRFRFHTHTVMEDLNALSYRENYNSAQARETNSPYFYGIANKRTVFEATFVGYKRATTMAKLGLETTNWSHKAITINSTSMTALTKGFSSTVYYVGSQYSYKHNGVTHVVDANDNIYVNSRCHSWYLIIGLSNSGTKTISNIHFNMENCSAIFYAISSGTVCNISNMSIRTYNFKSSYTTPNSNCTANIADLNLVLRGSDSSSYVITALYAGGYSSSTTGAITKLTTNTRVLIDGQRITSFYGGGNQVATLFKGNLDVTLRSGTVSNLYGGGLGGYVGTEDGKGNININIEGGKVVNLYGGGSGGFVTLYSSGAPLDVTSYTKDGRYFYNSTKKYYASTMARKSNKVDAQLFVKDYIVKDGGTPIGTYESLVYYDLYPQISDTSYINYYRYEYCYTISDARVVADITINLYPGANITNAIYGGGKNGAVKGDIEINIMEGASYNNTVYAGGEGLNAEISSTVLSTPFVWTNSLEDYVITQSRYEETCAESGTIFMSAPAGTGYTTPFLIKEELLNKWKQSDGKVYIYSGTIKKLGLIDGNTKINMNGTKIGKLYGGSNGPVASVSGNTSILINSGTVTDVYGGGNAGEVYNTNIEINNATITGTLYGGGNLADINGSSYINLTDAEATTVYGGGNNGRVSGDATIVSTRTNATNMYGGGNNGAILGNTISTVNGGTIETFYGGGNNGDVSGNSTVSILQGTITTAFGGGNLGKVDGNTNVVVGGFDNPVVNINNILYGGGRGANSTVETVKGNAIVLIEGYNTFVENYGSSKLGKVTGNVDVTFRNYWTGNSTSKYRVMNGIDRATNVYFDNSYVLLENKDENGNLEGIKDITNMFIPYDSGLKVSADGELKGDFHGGGEFYLDSEVCITVDGSIYGSSVLVLNPLLVDDIKMIKGSIDNPYVVIKGQDFSENNNALYSMDSRYDILNATQSGTNYKLYYIDRDIPIYDTIENTVFNNVGAHYTDSTSTWPLTDAVIRTNAMFTSDVQTTINFQVPIGETMYNDVTRGIKLVTGNTPVNFPENTVVSFMDGTELYKYTVTTPTSEILLHSFARSRDESLLFEEVSDIISASELVSESALTGKVYLFEEAYRFVVDFSGVELENYLPKKPYNFMMTYRENGAIMTEMEDKAKNVVKVEDIRKYTTSITSNYDYFEPGEHVEFKTSISSVADPLSDELYGNQVFAVLSLRNSEGELVPLHDAIKVYINGTIVPHTNSNVKYLMLNDIEMSAFNVNKTVLLDFTQIPLGERIELGNYSFVVEYYIGQPSGTLLKKIGEAEKGFEVKMFNIGGFYCIVTENGIQGIDLLNVSSDAPNRSIEVKYEGDLRGPNVEIKAYKRTGDNPFTDISNVMTVSRINPITNTQTISFARESTLTTGQYKLLFILKDEAGTEKTHESMIFVFN